MGKLELVLPYLCGVDAKHSPDFLIDRERDPYGSCLILGFRSNAVIQTERGMKNASPGDCIIHTPDFRQYHAAEKGASDGYRNDWLHAGSGIVAPLMEKYGLQFNVLLHTGFPDILSSFILRIRREASYGEAFCKEMIRLQLELMLATVARSLRRRPDGACLSRSEQRYYSAFLAERTFLYENLGKPFSVKAAASRLHLSPERFAGLYAVFFHRSPYNDLVEMRLNHAKSLLVSSRLSIKEISALCGWEDYHYFSRIFRRKNGIAPTGFRKREGG